MVAQRDDWLSLEDFLALDRETLDQKYEYIDGHMYALAGGSTNHSIITSHANRIVGNHIQAQSSPCVTFSGDMTLKIYDACFLPDVERVILPPDKPFLGSSPPYMIDNDR